MAKIVDITEYFPEIMKEVAEFKSLATAENPELTELWTELDNVMADQFIDTLSENGVKRWEKMMHIKPLDTDNLDLRKFRIKARYNEQLPYTMATLITQLERLCGEGGYFVSLVGYELTVKIDLGVKKKYDEVQKMLNRICPCNVLIDLSLLYNTWETVSSLTWQQVSAMTWQQLREDVII